MDGGWIVDRLFIPVLNVSASKVVNSKTTNEKMISDFTDEKLDIFTKLFDITETTKLVSTIVTNDMKSRFQMNYAIEI
ncbi:MULTISPECIES: hypothetical protein [Enterococcus]|nr:MULTISPECIES: hypothetical protein [Enterococcus]MUP21159.1 hypothetical protein [Enterococcus lactis]OAQ45595.1 hypothetical protein A5489_03090 [Enterococcus faecium]